MVPTQRRICDLYPEAKQLVLEHQNATIPFLSRKLRISFEEANRLTHLLEQRGVIGNHSFPRIVYYDSHGIRKLLPRKKKGR